MQVCFFKDSSDFVQNQRDYHLIVVQKCNKKGGKK